MASVEISDVVKAYGAVQVVHGVSVDIADGEFLVLVGPSGCGKSTLLRMIAGLEEISGGTVSIGDEVVNDVAPKDRNIAMVFQNYALYPHMTVAENMAFSLKLAGVAKPDIRAKVKLAAGILGLEKLLDRYPGQLSGGQRQRVAMGRAIVRDPEVFLFDEPLSNLDAKLRVQMRTEIKALHQRLKTTTIYVTHDQVEAMTMADRIVVMRDGLVEQIGSPLDLYDQPRNLFVAGFIGSPSMNFIRGRLGGGKFHGEGGIEIALGKSASREDGHEVVCGIRPDKVGLGNSGAEVDVIVVEPTGAETQVVVDAGGAQIVCLLRDRVAIRPGEKIRLALDAKDVHLFDAATGARLDTSQATSAINQPCQCGRHGKRGRTALHSVRGRFARHTGKRNAPIGSNHESDRSANCRGYGIGRLGACILHRSPDQGRAHEMIINGRQLDVQALDRIQGRRDFQRQQQQFREHDRPLVRPQRLEVPRMKQSCRRRLFGTKFRTDCD